MNRNVLETVMGGLVLVVALIFLTFAYSSAGIRTVSGYDVTAKFERIDGIKIGSDVYISGMKVGTITAAALDPKTFEVRVHMTIDKAYELPVDTVAEITTPSLLGDNIMALVPGNQDETIKPGGAIDHTVGPKSLMSMIEQVLFSVSSGSPPAENGAKPPSPAPTAGDGAEHKP